MVTESVQKYFMFLPSPKISGFSTANITGRAATIISDHARDTTLQVKKKFGFIRPRTINHYFVLKTALLLCIGIIKLCVHGNLSVYKKFWTYKSLLCCCAPKMCPFFNNNARHIK